jgi:hypothetical protein
MMQNTLHLVLFAVFLVTLEKAFQNEFYLLIYLDFWFGSAKMECRSANYEY